MASKSLLNERSGLSFVADDMSASVKGHTTNFDGDANSLFTYSSPSTKYVRNSAGLLVPGTTMRCDHDASGNKLGLLIEEQRTNLALRSEDLGTTWGSFNVTNSLNATVAPDGVSTADKRVETATNAEHGANQSITIVNATVYTWSIFAKAGERSWIVLNPYDGSSYKTWFDLSNGVVGANAAGNTASIQSYGNGWYRCIVTRTSAGTGGIFQTLNAPGDNVASYAGDITKGVYFWGAQLEAGAFATSYIPTAGSQVTRAADNITLLATAFPLNAAEGTIFAEFIPARAIVSGNPRVLRFAGTGNNYIEMAGFSSTPDKYSLVIRTDAGFQADLSSASANYNATYGSRFRLAGAYKANDSASSANGNTASTDTSVALPTVTGLALGSTSGGSHLNGHLRRFRFVPRRRPDAEMQAITV